MVRAGTVCISWLYRIARPNIWPGKSRELPQGSPVSKFPRVPPGAQYSSGTPQEKSRWVKSGEHGGQLTEAHGEIRRPMKWSCSQVRLSRDVRVWVAGPSSWNDCWLSVSAHFEFGACNQGGDVYATGHREGRLGPSDDVIGSPDWERQVLERKQSGGHGGNLPRFPVVGGVSDNRRHSWMYCLKSHAYLRRCWSSPSRCRTSPSCCRSSLSRCRSSPCCCRSSPCRCWSSPSPCRSSPAWAATGPARAAAGPACVAAGPARAAAGPVWAAVGPARVAAGPARAPAGPARATASPARAAAGPARAATGPTWASAGPVWAAAGEPLNFYDNSDRGYHRTASATRCSGSTMVWWYGVTSLEARPRCKGTRGAGLPMTSHSSPRRM